MKHSFVVIVICGNNLLVVDCARILQGWVKIGLLQKTEFEPGRVTAQRVILLLPSLIDNTHFIICIGPIPSYLKL